MFDLEHKFYSFNAGTGSRQAHRTRLTLYLTNIIDVYSIINSAFCLSVILNRHMSLPFSISREHNRRIP